MAQASEDFTRGRSCGRDRACAGNQHDHCDNHPRRINNSSVEAGTHSRDWLPGHFKKHIPAPMILRQSKNDKPN